MNPTEACLSEQQLTDLLCTDASPQELSRFEQHLSQCDLCSRRVEKLVGDNSWWSDVHRSLSQLTEDDQAPLAGEPQMLIKQLQQMLGPTDDPAMLGRIGGYEVVGLLGRGGMGAVFKAFDRSLNRYVAIKLLLPHVVANGAARTRFAREAQAAAAVVDDHVMPILAVDSWQDVPYLVMPYYRGRTLHHRLSDQGPLAVREILRIAHQSASALAAAHDQGIIHRDVKPGNIFLDSGIDRARLMDFGLARAVDDAALTRTGVLAGTPQFMSPEQVRGESLDPRSDLFSLGAVLYAMCTGKAPFRAESSYAVLRMITDHQPNSIREANAEIPEWLEEIAMRLMAKAADDRFASAREVADLLEECLAHVQRPTINPLPVILRSTKPSINIISPITNFLASQWREHPMRTLLTTSFLFVLLGTFVVTNHAQESEDKNQSMVLAKSVQTNLSDLQRIGQAMHRYHKANKHFLPAVVDGKNGEQHSWRVALLPHLGMTELYTEYRLDEPWDSEANEIVMRKIPDVYIPEFVSGTLNVKDALNTSYFAVVGDGTAFDADGKGTAFKNFFDGLSNTLLVVESKRDVPWTKPQDIEYSKDKPLPKLGGTHKGGFSCVFADGHAQFIPDTVPSQLIRDIITRNGGEVIDLQQLQPKPLN